jgi:multidrug efflux pump subunit AcrA (membrane-fusion protein)
VLQLLNIRSLVIAVVLAGVLVLDVACSPPPAPQPSAAPTAAPAATAVSADTARRRDIQQSLSYSGDIRAREQINMLPKSSGRVQQVLVDTGSHVKADDSPALLEQDSAQISAEPGAVVPHAGICGASPRSAR